ncbi:UNVERIFIED_CONTAM: hypothetical protein FKN15_037698 [Acipenser sinensis]
MSLLIIVVYPVHAPSCNNADGLFGRCQDPLTRERVLYEVSVPVLQRLQEVLKQLMMQGLSWQDDITQYIISQEMARVPRVYSSPSPKEAAVDKLSPQPGSPALCFTPASSASVTLYFPQHGHPNA